MVGWLEHHCGVWRVVYPEERKSKSKKSLLFTLKPKKWADWMEGFAVYTL